MAEIFRTFPHRLNLDGTFDSICPDCLRTISNEQFEIDLNPPERNHHCDPILLDLLWDSKRHFNIESFRFEPCGPHLQGTESLRSELLGSVCKITTFIAFDRQQKRNGTVNSVCILCQQIIATGQDLIDLIPSEIVHRCDTAQILPREHEEMRHA
jgi:hypothetical protein